MSQQNKQTNTSTSSDLPVKRKRGRPRKDENLVKKENSPVLPVTPPSDGMKKIEQVKVNSSNNIDSDMVGRVVSGVIEGTFDAGYFLSVRAGNSNTLMRGVVFQPGQFTPISAANDIAPQVKMYTRREFPIPAFNPQSPVSSSIPQSSELQPGSSPYAPNNQPATVMVPTDSMPKNDPSASLGEKETPQQDPQFGFGNQPAQPLNNLRIVEKDKVMQPCEATKDGISESASESMVDILLGNETIDQVPQGQNRDVECGLEPSELVHNELEKPILEFHQTTLVSELQSVPPQPQSEESGFKPSEFVNNELKSVNLELNQTPLVASEPLEPESVELEHNPSELVQNKPKCLNLELQQPPAAVEPQAVPADPISEPMDIVTENLISPKNDILRDMQPELAAKVLRNDENSPNGKPASNAADYTEGGSQSTPGTLEVMPSKPEFAAEECVFPGRLETEISSFPGQSANVEFGLGDAIPPTQSHCYPSYVSENENR